MIALISARVDHLSIWDVHVYGDLFTPFGESHPSNSMILCCYFNLGIDSEIGLGVER
jgi:hypothetical protein